MIVPKYCFTRSGYSRTAASVSVKITPCRDISSRSEPYTTSLSYCAFTPARNFFSASGMPSLSKVLLISAGTSSHDFTEWSVGLR